MLSVEPTKAKKKAPKDPESMECTCVIFPFVPPTDDSYMEIDWAAVKKKHNIQDGYSDDTEESEDEDEGRIATNLKSMTVAGKKGGKKVKVRTKAADFFDLGQGYANEDDDDFIDNSEQYDEYVPSYLDTEYGGFYINEGPVEFREIDDAVRDAEDQDEAEERAGDDGTSSGSSSTDSEDSSSDGSSTDNADEAVDQPVKKHRKKKAKAVRSAEVNGGDDEPDGVAAKTKDDAIESMEVDDASKDKRQPEKEGVEQILSSDESDATTMTETTVTDEDQQSGAESRKPPRLAGMPPIARLAGMPPGVRMPPADRLAGMPPTARLSGAPPTARLVGQPPRMKTVKNKMLKTSEKEKQRVKKVGDGKAAAKPKPVQESSRSDAVARHEDATKENAGACASKASLSKPAEKSAASTDIGGTQQDPRRSDVSTTSTKQPEIQAQQIAETPPQGKKQTVTDLPKTAARPTPFTHMFSAAALSKPPEKLTVPIGAKKPDQTAGSATNALRQAHAAAVQAEQMAQKTVGTSAQAAKPSGAAVVTAKGPDGSKSLRSEKPQESSVLKSSVPQSATHRQPEAQAPPVIDLTQEGASQAAAKAVQGKSQPGGVDYPARPNMLEQYMRSLLAQQYQKDAANAQPSDAACDQAHSRASSSSSGNEDPSDVFRQYFARAVSNKAQVTKPTVARLKPSEARPHASSSAQSSAASSTGRPLPASKQPVTQADLAAVLAQYAKPAQTVEQFRQRFQPGCPPTAQQIERRAGPTTQNQTGSSGAVAKPTPSTSSSKKPDTSKNPPDVIDIE